MITRISRPLSTTSPEGLLARADRLLMTAAGEDDSRERFRVAYLAALRGAGAVFAMSAARRGRGRTGNAWMMLARSEPGFAMWADYFAAFSDTRAALEAGITRRITDDRADDFYARVGAFLHDVADRLADRSVLCV